MTKIPALDGIRGLAILLVFACHARGIFVTSTGLHDIPLPVFHALVLGWSGVDFFFALSGFLITGILLETRTSAGYFRNFYVRRFLRIFPLYFGFLFVVFVLIRNAWRLLGGSDPWSTVHPWWYWAYLQNFKPNHGFRDLFLEHFWSLAIEEHFYLVWPLVVWITPRRNLTWICVGLAVTSLILRIHFSQVSPDGQEIYRMTPFRIDGLALGSLTAVAFREYRSWLDRWASVLLGFGAVGFLLILRDSPTAEFTDPPIRTIGASFLAIMASACVFLAASGRNRVVQRVCCCGWLRSCGKYSYALYVFHYAALQGVTPFVAAISRRAFPHWEVLAIEYSYPPVLFVLLFGLARLSWQVLEEPFLRMKSKFAYVVVDPALGSAKPMYSAAHLQNQLESQTPRP